MTLHKTLIRQISKYFGNESEIPDRLRDLFVAISDTYNHFDEDLKLVERSLEISSKELSDSVSKLQATLDSTRDGILVVDREGKITGYSKRFAEMWNIPQEILLTHDDNKTIAFVLNQLKYPDVFLAKVKEFYEKPETEGDDILEFKDGKIFERSTHPQRVGTSIIGRVWNYHDATKRMKAEQQLKEKMEELEKLNKFMVAREIKMVELKKQIEKLQTELANKQ
jgi:PAS domain-containing protein